MLELKNIDLSSDPQSLKYVKNETVEVVFAAGKGELISREGPNRYQEGDALITGATGDRWCVSRGRFDVKYEAVSVEHGMNGAYRNRPIPVLARQIFEPFCIRRSEGGDLLKGKPGDWLMQYAPGDYGITENSRFIAVYKAQT